MKKGKDFIKKEDHLDNLLQQIIDRYEAIADGKYEKGWAVNVGGVPKNAFTGVAYRGINIMGLSLAGYDDDRWCSFNQAVQHNKEHGTEIRLRKGEKGVPIFAYVMKNIISKAEREKIESDYQNKVITQEQYNELNTKAQIPVLAYSTHLFNASQFDNFPIKPEHIKLTEFEEVKELELIATSMSQMRDVKIITHHEDSAYFSPSQKAIYIPPKSTFKNESDYYRTLMHESVHATGHEDMLNRTSLKDYSTDITVRAREELVAELGSFIACKTFGVKYAVQTDTNHIEYMRGWLSALKGEDGKKELVKAFASASKAVDCLVAVKQEYVQKLEIDKQRIEEISAIVSKNHMSSALPSKQRNFQMAM